MTDQEYRRVLGSEEFLRLIWKQPHRLGWFLGYDKLKPIHSEWIRYCWDSDRPRALQAFRGGYKTTAIDVVGSIRWMLFHPNDRIAIIRKSFNAAAEVTNTIARLMFKPEVMELFRLTYDGFRPKVTRRQEGKYEWNFKTTRSPEGNLTPLGLESGITGLHFDKIVCDDIITIKDRISRAERERAKEMTREIAANIIEPDKGSAWIGTPWHREDAWTVINQFCDILQYPLSKNNFIGKKAAEQKRLMTTPYLYAANYELKLGADESLLFSDPILGGCWDHTAHGVQGQLDTAFDGDHYNALTIASPTRKEGKVRWYQAVGFTYAGNVEDWEDKIVALYHKYHCVKLYVEKNADKGACAKRLAARGLRVVSYTESMNKDIKIGIHLYNVWRCVEWCQDTDDEYMAQVMEYKKGVEPDDAPDSAASLFREGYSNNVSGYSQAVLHGI
jgi:hypothetical protein